MTTSFATSRGPAPRPPTRSGHTLMELVVAITISGVLMVGLTSTLYVASRAVHLSGPSRAAFDASGAEANVLGELQYAVSFTERSNHAVEFTVADRNGDSVHETIRYAWSGAAGDPLTRQYNGGEPVTLVQDVREFDLAYVVQETAETTNPGTSVDSGEVLLASFEGWPGILPNHAWKVAICSEYLVVDVPPDVTQLTITRVELQMKQLVGGYGDKLVAIHHPSGGGPEPDLNARIGTQSVKANAELPVGGGWTEFAFSDVVIDDPPNQFCIVVDGTSVLAGSVLFYSHTSAPTDTPVGLWSTNGGATWDPSTKRNQNDMLFRLYGSYQTPGTGSGGLTRYFITRVNGTLRVGSAPESRIDGGVRVLNTPEVAAP